jgi:uncharacterized protein
MPGKYVVSLTCETDDPDKATVAFVVANAAVASDKDTVVCLSTEGTRRSQMGAADNVAEAGFATLTELMTNFAKAVARSTSAPPVSRSARSTRTSWCPAQ